jgi:hypothetical protein
MLLGELTADPPSGIGEDYPLAAAAVQFAPAKIRMAAEATTSEKGKQRRAER